MTSMTENARALMLDDSTSLLDLVDFERRTVSLRVLSDPAVYRLEMNRLFARTWVLLGHETEIPRAGDFVVRYIGDAQVVVARDRTHGVHALSNVCSHRGMAVCRADVGNARRFRCPYHGFLFDLDGCFRGAPFQKDEFGSEFEKSEFDLRRARVELFYGFIFGTWDAQGEDLRTFLGDLGWYLEAMWNRSDGGLEVGGPPQRSVIRSNWKVPMQQAGGDGYHPATLHVSSVGRERPGGGVPEASVYGVNVSMATGNLRAFGTARQFGWNGGDPGVGDRLRRIPPAGMTPDMVDQMIEHLSPEQIYQQACYPPGPVGLFPNAGYISRGAPFLDGRPTDALFNILHLFSPRGPDATELWTWCFVESDSPAWLKSYGLQQAVQNMGIAGGVEQDDVEAWVAITRASRTTVGQAHTMKHPTLTGDRKPEDWPGPGRVHDGISRDDCMWNWWLTYFSAMSGGPSRVGH
jgi:nitrite reductase/ring-hydroxylating ferredoxin subunit